MAQYVDRKKVENILRKLWKEDDGHNSEHRICYNKALQEVQCELDTLEVKDPYEQCVQYPSIKDGIEAHASIYSFNIESQLFPQLTKEQQTLWRKEIEQACISGGDAGVTLARDQRYKENVEVEDTELQGIEKEVAEGHVGLLDEKRVPIELKGVLKAKFKNEFNTLWQIVHGIQFANVAKHIVERICLNFATWGAYNLKNIGKIEGKTELAEIEKQGEKTNPYSGISFEYNGHIWGMCARDNGVDILLDKQLFKHLEKQGEQKPIDNIKPKFKVGDWITNGYVGGQITSIEDNYPCYKIADFMGGINTSIPFSFQDNYHLWTIRDAKDGDILAAHECYVIFKEIDGLNIKCHCTYHYIGFNPSFHINTLQNKTAFHPATKEQRDALMKAMADARYTFDFENKELKKIDNEEFNGEDYGIDSLYHAQRILEKTLGKVDGYQSDDGILEHECAITAVKKLYEQKPTWSEEDERKIKDIVYFLDTAKKHYASTVELDACIDWLKSLKQRAN